MHKLQSADYAALTIAATQLREEIMDSPNFKKIMSYGELPRYTADISLNIEICEASVLPPDKFSLKFQVEPRAQEVADEDDDDCPY